MTIMLLFVLGCGFFPALGVKSYFESFEQTLGQDKMWFNFRVRKYNRTTPVLNGTIFIFHEFGNELIFSFDIFYSRLGNQQFSHLPIHLPTRGMCDFIDNVYKFYPDVMDYFINPLKEGECPISIREVHLLDLEYPNQVVPATLKRKGLWKAIIHGYLRGNEIIRYNLISKVADD